MAIIIFCSGCKVRLTLGDDRDGTTFDCPRCATTISIPSMLSSQQSSPPQSRPRPIAIPAPLPSVTPFPRPVEQDDEGTAEKAVGEDRYVDNAIDTVLTRRRRHNDRKHLQIVVISAFTAIIAALLGATTIYFVMRDRNSDIVAELGGLTSYRGLNKSCTLTELVEHLIQNKLCSNAMYAKASPRESRPFESLLNERIPCAFIDGVPGSDRITIFECDDELAAKHGARQAIKLLGHNGEISPEKLQYMAFSWGRFGFLTSDEVLGKQVKQLLRIE